MKKGATMPERAPGFDGTWLSFMSRWLRSVSARALTFALGCLLTMPCTAIAQTQTAVEYYYATWNQYFVTSLSAEIDALDGGAFGGAWQRTGQTFTVWSSQVAGSSPVCRFFSTTFAPKSSHFYTPIASECDIVKASPAWQFEATAFYLQIADELGNCPAGSVALYRLYNNGMGGAPNHRYTTSPVIVADMQSAGWTAEGFGPPVVLACVPSYTFVFRVHDKPASEEFRYVTSSETFIAKARDQLRLSEPDRQLFPAGHIAAGNGGYNLAWSWHFVDAELTELAIEVCDGIPSGVEADLAYWLKTVGIFCPWLAYVYSELP